MKTTILILLLAVCALQVYSQNITNILGTGWTFIIKDASNDYLTLSQSDGFLSLNNNLNFSYTYGTNWVITKGGLSFIHDFGGSWNTFVGIYSGNFTMSGTGFDLPEHNTGFGYFSLRTLTTGGDNTAVGMHSLDYNTEGDDNTAVGYASLFGNGTGYENTAVGTSALKSNTTGYYNTAVGTFSLDPFGYVTGNYNTAVGHYSLFNNTAGSSNTAMGIASLYSDSAGSSNTAVGWSSLYSNKTGDGNTAVGYASLYLSTFTSNTAVGYYSLFNSTTGYMNTALGKNAGIDITKGGKNSLIGWNAQPSVATVLNEITLGNGSVTSLRCAVQTITSLSDARDKKNIHDLSLGIDLVMKLKPRLFNWDKREWYTDKKSDGSKMKETPTAGFIAQELDEVQIKENAEWLNLVLKDNPEKLEATPGNLLPVMVKSLRELKAKNSRLKDKLNKYEQMQNVLTEEIEQLQSSKEN